MVAIGAGSAALAQRPPLPPQGGYSRQATAAVVEEVPPMVLINKKPADQLTDEEKIEFLEEKIKTIFHDDGHVHLSRVAPGYPLTVTFEEPIQQVIVGDQQMAVVQPLANQRQLLVMPRVRSGDTSIQVFFPGNKLRVYHLFIVENLADGAETAIRVVSFGKVPSPQTFGMTGRGRLDIRTITQVIRNYDALKQEKAIDFRMVKRDEIFR